MLIKIRQATTYNFRSFMKKCLLLFFVILLHNALKSQSHNFLSSSDDTQEPYLELTDHSPAYLTQHSTSCVPKHKASFTVVSAVQCLDWNSFSFDNTTLTGTGTVTYKWNFGDQLTSSEISPVHRYGGVRDYVVELTAKDDVGCTSVATQTVTVLTSPSKPVITYPAGGNVFCEGDSVVLRVSLGTSPDPDVSFQWALGSTPVATGTSFTAKNSGTYLLVATHNNSCKDSSSVDVTQNPNPQQPSIAAASGYGLQFCQGDSTLLLVNTSNQGVDYSWYLSSGSVNNLISGAASNNYWIKTPANIAGSPITRTYRVRLKDGNNCSSLFSEPVSVVTHPTPSVNLAVFKGDLSFCIGDSTTLKVSSRYGPNTYQWVKDMVTNAAVADSFFVVKSSGSYAVKATNGYSCSVTTDPISIISFSIPETPVVAPLGNVPEVISGGGINMCPATTIELSTAARSSAVYRWERNGQPLNNGTSRTLQVNDIGNYRVTISINNCTATSTETIVGILPSPNGTLHTPSNSFICNGSQKTLSASGAVGYQWLKNGVPILEEDEAQLTTSSPGVYTVEFSSDKGCKKMSSNFINLSLIKKPVAKFSNDLFCINATAKFTNHSITAYSGSVEHLWKFGNGTTDNSMHSTHTFPVSGQYMVSLKVTPIACPQLADSNSVSISVESTKSGMSYTPITSMEGKSVSLVARPLGDFYEWSPAAGFNSPYLRIPLLTTPEREQLYTVKITTKSGCQVVDSQLVRIFDEQDILVAGGFTPNNDGKNDKVYPILIGVASFQYIKIFNRWGNLVFQTSSTDPEQGWDGRYQGQPQPADTYTWVVHGVGDNGREIRKSGSVILIR
ncbi:MAG: PKD domain-containing protein [bacterium]